VLYTGASPINRRHVHFRKNNSVIGRWRHEYNWEMPISRVYFALSYLMLIVSVESFLPVSDRITAFAYGVRLRTWRWKMRDLRVTFEVFVLQTNICFFFVDVNTPNIDKSIRSRANSISRQIQSRIYEYLPWLHQGNVCMRKWIVNRSTEAVFSRSK